MLDAALGYIEAKAGGPVKGKLPVRFEALRIPAVSDGRVRLGSVPLTALSEFAKVVREFQPPPGPGAK